MFSNQVELDKQGFIITDNSMKTSTKGVFAIGDIRNTPLRQVVTAVADGAIAGVSVSKYILSLKDEIKITR
jgi:thioredoxin reductase (NADPH)